MSGLTRRLTTVITFASLGLLALAPLAPSAGATTPAATIIEGASRPQLRGRSGHAGLGGPG